MRRILFYIIKVTAIISRVLRSRELYMLILRRAHSINGVHFIGKPRFIHPSVVLDTTEKITLGDNIVISSGVLFLTHDYSFTAGLISINEKPKTDIAFIQSITVGDNCFIGANSTILPGTKIGSNVIIGAGSVVKGTFLDFSVIAGNPAAYIKDIRIWVKTKKEEIDKSNLLIDKN